jgi:hypothetical protein
MALIFARAAVIRSRAFFLGLLALALSHPRTAFSWATGADFLLMEPSARAVAGGGAFAASLSGLDSLSYNPAGLAGLGQALHTSFSHVQSFGGWQYDSAALGFPRWGLDFGAEFSSSRLQPFQVYDDLGDPAGFAGAGNLVYGLSCGSQSVIDHIWSGLRVRGFSSELAGYTSQGFALDGGLIYRPLDHYPLNFGFSVQNLGAQSAFVEDADPLPLLYRLGVDWSAYKNEHYSGAVKADLVVNMGDNRPDQGRAGIELQFYHAVFASAGMQMDPVRGLHYMFGAGMNNIAGLGVSYAYLPHETLGAAHRISLDYQYELAGGAAKKAAVAAPTAAKAADTARPQALSSTATPVLSMPLNFKAYAYTGGFALYWTPAPSMTGFNIYFKDHSGNWTRWNADPVRGDRLRVSSPSAGLTYTFLLRPVGGEGLEGPASDEVSVTTK